MQLFGLDLWRIILIVTLIFLVAKRANLVALLAKKQYYSREFAKALKTFRIADKIGNLSPNNKMSYGYLCLRLGELDEARKHLTLCLGLIPKEKLADRNRVRNILALVLWKEGHLNEAIEMLEEVMESGFKSTTVYQNLGIFYNLTGDAQKALAFNQEAYEYNEDDAIICDNLADAYAISGDYEQSAKQYEALLKKDPPPHFPEAYYGYGKVLLQLGRKEEGLAKIKESLDKSFSYLSICSKEEIEQLYIENGGTLED